MSTAGFVKESKSPNLRSSLKIENCEAIYSKYVSNESVERFRAYLRDYNRWIF